MPKRHPEAVAKGNAFQSLAGVGLAGSIYGGALWAVLWFVRSAEIAEWDAPYWKCAVITLAINALRLYDRKVFTD